MPQIAQKPLPSTLVAIIIAARRSGDRDLERQTRRTLEAEHGMRVSFALEPRTAREGRRDD
jgi:hypothetical protein